MALSAENYEYTTQNIYDSNQFGTLRWLMDVTGEQKEQKWRRTLTHFDRFFPPPTSIVKWHHEKVKTPTNMTSQSFLLTNQWRIQDFLRGGRNFSWGAPRYSPLLTESWK